MAYALPQREGYSLYWHQPGDQAEMSVPRTSTVFTQGWKSSLFLYIPTHRFFVYQLQILDTLKRKERIRSRYTLGAIV